MILLPKPEIYIERGKKNQQVISNQLEKVKLHYKSMFFFMKKPNGLILTPLDNQF